MPTIFTGYTGVGYGSGPATNPNQTDFAVAPVPLTDSAGTSFSLTLSNYDEKAADGVQNTAELIPAAVPEVSSAISLGTLFLLGFGGILVARRKTARS